MAEQQPGGRSEKDPGTAENGHEEERASYEQELADYLEERIKPGLNRGAIPLVARSIAKEIAKRGQPNGAADDEPGTESEAPPDFEADMHELQAELGEDWILRFSVHGDDAWLTAEKDDESQRVEAATASELLDAVAKLDQGDGGST